MVDITTKKAYIEVVEEDNYDKFGNFEEIIRAIERVSLYDPVRAIEMCLVLNMMVLKEFITPTMHDNSLEGILQ